MRRATVFGTAIVLLLAGTSWSAPQSAQSFDGNWLTMISCPNAAGTLGYSFQFPAQVRDGVLQGERLSPGRRVG